jgi:hypothetical protein
VNARHDGDTAEAAWLRNFPNAERSRASDERRGYPELRYSADELRQAFECGHGTALASARASAGPEWVATSKQPRVSGPTWFLVMLHGESVATVAKYYPSHETNSPQWLFLGRAIEPTHWMPLPKGPADDR